MRNNFLVIRWGRIRAGSHDGISTIYLETLMQIYPYNRLCSNLYFIALLFVIINPRS
jgi:hypothetical protein